LPGRLAVSRTMGDSEAKLPKYNGIPNVISAEPDVFSFKVSEEYDFLLLGCIIHLYYINIFPLLHKLKKITNKLYRRLINYLGDGIFDKMSTKEVI
jgi:hypothetical protein